MNYFFCDLRGTFDGSKNRKENLNDFFESINNLVDICHDDLTFCFITSDDNDYLNNFILETKSYFKEFQINQGPHFSESSEFENGIFKNIKYNNKIDQVRNYLDNKEVDRIFFADDSTSNQFMIRGIIKRTHPEAILTSFVPRSNSKDTDTAYFSSESGLSGLNKIINKYIISSKVISRYR